MKPDAPLEYRGEFRPIETSAPDIQVCEHLPLLAKNMHHIALVRSVRHSVNDHNAGAYYALTGRSPFEGSELIRSPSQRIFPTYGSVLAKFRPSGKPLPDFVHIPEVLSNLGDRESARLLVLVHEASPLVERAPLVTSIVAIPTPFWPWICSV